MSILTSGVVIGEELLDRPYIYPMSNATNGGEAHTEYNVRAALSNLVSYSAAFSNDDFTVSFRPATSDINNVHAVHSISLAITKGKGNCNAYFVSLDDFGTAQAPKTLIIAPTDHIPDGTNKDDYSFRFGLYLCVNYCNNIADGLCYRFICDGYKLNNASAYETEGTEERRLYEASYKGQGFNDIGICLGWSIYKGGAFSSFIPNPNKTRCIDLDRLGDETAFADKLSKLITRLQTLNIYGGDFYISNTIINGEDAGSEGIIDALGSDLRLKFSFNMEDLDSKDDSIPWKNAKYYILTDESQDYLVADSEVGTGGMSPEYYDKFVNGVYLTNPISMPTLCGAVDNKSAVFNRAIYSVADWKLKYSVRRDIAGQNVKYSNLASNYIFVRDLHGVCNSNDNIDNNKDFFLDKEIIAYSNQNIRGPFMATQDDNVVNNKIVSLTYLDQYLSNKKLKYVGGGENGKYLALNSPWTSSGNWISADENTIYMYRDINSSTGVQYLCFYAYDRVAKGWKYKRIRFVNQKTGLENILNNEEIGVFIDIDKNYYYYKDSDGELSLIKVTDVPILPNGDDNWFPVPVSKDYFFDGSGKTTHPTGAKIVTGRISLVKTELSGSDVTLTDLVKFTTKPITIPFNGIDESSKRVKLSKDIELNSKYIEFVQNISANQIYAKLIDADELLSNKLTLTDNLGNKVSANYTNINNSDAIEVKGSLTADRVYGAVWM